MDDLKLEMAYVIFDKLWSPRPCKFPPPVLGMFYTCTLRTKFAMNKLFTFVTYFLWVFSATYCSELYSAIILLQMWCCTYNPTSLIWHVWEMRKRSYYRGVTYSIIWQIGPGCHNNEVLHKNTLEIFFHI